MFDLSEIVTMNAEKPIGPPRIYDIGGGKFALGFKGQRAVWVVRRIRNKVDSLGRGLPTYQGVQARKPVIPTDAKLVRRGEAGRLLKTALGLNN